MDIYLALQNKFYQGSETFLKVAQAAAKTISNIYILIDKDRKIEEWKSGSSGQPDTQM